MPHSHASQVRKHYHLLWQLRNLQQAQLSWLNGHGNFHQPISTVQDNEEEQHMQMQKHTVQNADELAAEMHLLQMPPNVGPTAADVPY
jgi:hypothetical protein